MTRHKDGVTDNTHPLNRLPDGAEPQLDRIPLFEVYMRMAEELGVGKRVRFLGWQKNSAAVFGAADVIAVPSRHEPLGNVVLEAWAKKRPWFIRA